MPLLLPVNLHWSKYRQRPPCPPVLPCVANVDVQFVVTKLKGLLQVDVFVLVLFFSHKEEPKCFFIIVFLCDMMGFLQFHSQLSAVLLFSFCFLQKWIGKNKVLSIVLRDTLHQPQVSNTH